MIRFFFISIVFIQFSFSIPLLNRFIVPIYYSTSVTYGYDSNILKFSEKEKLDSEIEPWLLSGNTLASSVLKGSTSILYMPYIFSEHETQLKVKLNYSNFIDSSDKKYYSYSLKISQHLGAFEWLKLSYSLLPELYLRDYVDKDNPVYNLSDSSTDINSFYGGELYRSSFFSSEVMRIQYSRPIPFHKSYYSLSYSKQKQYYNSDFTEFDLDINDFKGGIYLRHIPHIKLSVNLSKLVAENITFQNGNLSTQDKDRGFDQTRIWTSVSLDKNYSLFFDGVGLSMSMENRSFSSSLVSDLLHMGRSHRDRKISIWVKKQIYNKLSAKFYGSYRSRSTNSSEEFVEGLKSFNKYDFFMTFTYNSNFNVYY